MILSPARELVTPLFPYDPRFVEVQVGGQTAEMSYVEAGDPNAEPVVLLHGNPTWSFLYRKVIPGLRRHRVIAVDLLGFGRSDKLQRMQDYTLENHVSALKQLLAKLGLEQVTLVVHDWGGPIGLSAAVDEPQRFARFVVMNSWAFAPDRYNRVPQPLKTFRTPYLGELLVLTVSGFVEVALPAGVVDRKALRGEPMRCYRAPHPNYRMRWPVLAFPRDIPMSPEDASYSRMRRTDEGLRELSQPTLLLWGKRDPVFPPRVARKFEQRMNVVESRTFDASHYLQEDVGPELAQAIDTFTTKHEVP